MNSQAQRAEQVRITANVSNSLFIPLFEGHDATRRIVIFRTNRHPAFTCADTFPQGFRRQLVVVRITSPDYHPTPDSSSNYQTAFPMACPPRRDRCATQALFDASYAGT